jgi:hypothetical protein
MGQIMTDKLRARAKELALNAYESSPFGDEKIRAIEAAILTGMREALREEPDEGMMLAGYNTVGDRNVYSVMAEARARGLE